jgi:hypothetical protein
MRGFVTGTAVAIAAAVFALFCGELALRAMGFSAPVWHQPDATLGWVLRPGVTGRFTKEGNAFVKVSDSGWRDREHALHKPAEVYRIAVLGDSYSEAMQVARDETYWALLPGRLQACGFQPGKKIEVLNFGVSGYGTAQEYVVLQSTAMRYAPDMVLLQFTNGNDVHDNSFALARDKSRPFFMLERDGALRIDESFVSSPAFRSSSSFLMRVSRELTDRSRVLQLVRGFRSDQFLRIAHARANDGVEEGLDPAVLAPPRDALWEDAWRITEGLITRMKDYATRNGARFAVLTVPKAIQVHPDRSIPATLQAKLGVPDLFYPDRRIAEFAQRQGILAVPLAPEMRRLAEETGTYFHGFEQGIGIGRGHWNATGHSTAADIIAQRLCAAGG